MREAVWPEPETSGVTFVDTTFHAGNPTKDGTHTRVLDGWLELTIKCDGSNDFYPTERFWGYTFIRVVEGPLLHFHGVPNMRYVLVAPDEDVIGGHIEETWYEVPGQGTVCGLWLNYGIRSSDGLVRRKASLLYPIQRAAVM